MEKSAGKGLGGPAIWVGWDLRELLGLGETVLARMIEIQIGCLPASSVRGGLSKGTMAFAST